ncbi:MAG: YidH family protein [Aquificaceae bacterium]
MLIAKGLPSAKDARIYMSIERTYLGYMKLSLYTLSFSVFLGKLEILADITQKIHVSVLVHNVAILLATLGSLLVVVGIITFYLDISYIEGGIEVSSKEVTDPRIYMAAERTFLAWIRTAIALIVFGFVIEKFEFFLEQLERVFNMHLRGDHRTLVSVGVFIIVVGLLTLIIGAINFYRTIKQVDRGRYRTHTWLYKTYGAVIFLACLVLTFYVLKII